jgi:hypothetical protein
VTGFRKATKQQARARIAFAGPTGSGKTYTALTWARVLGERVGVIDTERGSASLYADLFEFDTLDLAPPYHPTRLIEALAASAAAGHDVTVIDSTSHFWAGEGGVLEIVDQAKTGTDSFRAWSKGTPLQQRMVDAILRHPGHVIVTMRSKTEYALVDGDRGKKTVEKVGMAPVQRDGIEYEFTVIQDVDQRHIAHVTKTRCPLLADRDIAPEHTEAAAREFAAWLGTGEPPPPAADPAAVTALSERLYALPNDVGAIVRHEWQQAGLPALKHVTTAADLDAAVALVDRLVPAQRQPEDESQEVPA